MKNTHDSAALMLALYQSMARIRAVEECVAMAYPQQKMRCPVHLCTGQEAVAAGACHALAQSDSVFTTHRSHGPYLAKGGDVAAFFKELHGKAGGCTGGRGGSMHLGAPEVGFLGAVPILASSIALATGAALAYQMRRERTVSMVIFGDGATEEGAFHESLHYAMLKKLPVVYICENNGFSVNTPLLERRAPESSLVALAQAQGMYADSGDGNNVLDVHTKAQAAVDRARAGEGPSFLEFSTYRWVEHCGPADDHHLAVRSVEEGAAWKQRCPLKMLERELVRSAGVTADELAAMQDALRAEAHAALQEAESAPWPEAGSAHTKVYAHA